MKEMMFTLAVAGWGFASGFYLVVKLHEPPPPPPVHVCEGTVRTCA